MKCDLIVEKVDDRTSPLAEGRELKYAHALGGAVQSFRSPLAEGRELKCAPRRLRGERGAVAPRGGA